MHDPIGTPWVVVIVMFLFPFVLAVFLGLVTFRRMTPLVFRCRRCNCNFHRAPHRPFPAVCPLCHARDWNA